MLVLYSHLLISLSCKALASSSTTRQLFPSQQAAQLWVMQPGAVQVAAHTQPEAQVWFAVCWDKLCPGLQGITFAFVFRNPFLSAGGMGQVGMP